MTVPTSIAVFVDRTGLMPVVPQRLVLQTANPVAVGKFYRALGIEIRIEAAADGRRYYAGRTIGLELSIVPAAQSAPHVGTLYFIVDDFPRALALVSAEGGKLVRPVTGLQRRATLVDPDGRRVIIGDQGSFQSKFDDLDADHRRSEPGDPDDGIDPVDFTDRAVRRGLQFERAAAAVTAVGTAILGVAALVLFGRIASGTDRDYLLLQMKPSQSAHYVWAWIALVGEGLVVAGRGVCFGSSDRFAKTGYAILATCVDVVAVLMGLMCLLRPADSIFMGSILLVVALGGIVTSSRLQEAAGRFRRPELRFWTKGATGASCSVVVLPVVGLTVAAMLPRGSNLATRAMQAGFLIGLFMQFCLHAVYVQFVHKAISDPNSLDGADEWAHA